MMVLAIETLWSIQRLHLSSKGCVRFPRIWEFVLVLLGIWMRVMALSTWEISFCDKCRRSNLCASFTDFETLDLFDFIIVGSGVYCDLFVFVFPCNRLFLRLHGSVLWATVDWHPGLLRLGTSSVCMLGWLIVVMLRVISVFQRLRVLKISLTIHLIFAIIRLTHS